MADMKELLLNIFDIGIGVATLTKEKLEELQKEVVEKGRMTREEGLDFVEGLRRRSEKAREQLDLWVARRVEEQVKKLDLATREDVAELQRKIDELHSLLNRNHQ